MDRISGLVGLRPTRSTAALLSFNLRGQLDADVSEGDVERGADFGGHDTRGSDLLAGLLEVGQQFETLAIHWLGSQDTGAATSQILTTGCAVGQFHCAKVHSFRR